MAEFTLESVKVGREKWLSIRNKAVLEGVAEMKPMQLTLQDDPSNDMSKLQGNIAIVQGFLGSITRLLNNAHKLQAQLGILMNQAIWVREDRVDEVLLIEDIRKARPKAAQEAKINGLLKIEDSLIRSLKNEALRFKAYLEIVVENQTYVKKTLMALAMQVGVLKGQVSIGEHRTNFDEGRQRI